MYAVRAVPKTVINNVAQVLGAVPEDVMVAKVLEVGVKEEGEREPPQHTDAPGNTSGPSSQL